MTLRVAFDLDGVLADMDAALGKEAEQLFGSAAFRSTNEHETTVTPDAGHLEGSDGDASQSGTPLADVVTPQSRLQLTVRQTRRLWRHVRRLENFWESLSELEPGAVEHLASIAATRRWEVIFLTRRPETEGATAQMQTQRWLQAKGFPMPSVYVVSGSRGRIAEALALHVVIDDRPENCVDVLSDSSARAILVWRGEDEGPVATARRLGIGIVNSVHECLDILTEAETTSSDRPGLMSRLMRRLGLKDEAATAG